MLNVIWRETALDDLEALVEYVFGYNPAAAHRLQALFEDRAERLAEHPFMYRPGRIPGTREAVVHPNYILVYRVDAASVEIVNIIHSRRQYPPAQNE